MVVTLTLLPIAILSKRVAFSLLLLTQSTLILGRTFILLHEALDTDGCSQYCHCPQGEGGGIPRARCSSLEVLQASITEAAGLAGLVWGYGPAARLGWATEYL